MKQWCALYVFLYSYDFWLAGICVPANEKLALKILKDTRLRSGVFIPTFKSAARDRLNIKMLSYQYSDSHYIEKTISRPSYVYNGNPLTWKTIYIETGPYLRRSCQPFLAAVWVIRKPRGKLPRHFHLPMSFLWGWIWQLEIIITEIMNGWTSWGDK